MSLELIKLDHTETERKYSFPNGESVVLQNVTHFLARPSGTHRLRTEDGKLHIVPTGWLHIEMIVPEFTL